MSETASKLNDLLDGVAVRRTTGDMEIAIEALAYDSRRVHRGSLFVALKGEAHDGNEFVAGALGRGAVAIVSEKDAGRNAAVPWVRVDSARRALSQMAANFYGHPAKKVKIIGITGTNGKTTTSYLLDSILAGAGHKAGLFGTVKHRSASGEVDAVNTTPESLDLQGFLAEWRDSGAEWAVMEVSSHGLAYERVYGVPFAAAVFTNLARDHLNYHGTMEAYFAAKQQLFYGQGAAPPGVCVLNADDDHGLRLAAQCQGRKILYGLSSSDAEVTGVDPKFSFAGTEFILRTPDGESEVSSPLVGRSNLYNMVAAGATTYALGFSMKDTVHGLESLERVPGRFERIDAGQPFSVVVDFAHTDLAFNNLLTAARELAPGRIIIVFGSGGDRDRSKRPVMGELAGQMADFVVLTTDNPRTEDPERIIEDIRRGLDPTGTDYWFVEDREEAFARAFDMAREGDIVLLAGKGHQQTQVYAGTERPWNEIEAAFRALSKCGYGDGTPHT